MAIFDSRKYAVTLKLIFLKAVYEIFPDIEVEIEHSLNNGTYGTVTKGEKITEELEGFPAIVMQHEFDHLEAVLFVDRISPMAKRMVTKKLQVLKKETLKGPSAE